MSQRKRLYNRAKQSNLSTDWGAYWESRNKVNSMLYQAHSMYQSRLFDELGILWKSQTILEICVILM